MGRDSNIEWCDHTFNPWIGCAKVSEACRYCYAESWAKRYDRPVWGLTAPRQRTAVTTWAQPRRWHRDAQASGVRARVFCASLADVFEAREDLDPIRADLWRLIEECHGLDWLLLTKRPEEILRRVPALWLEPGGWPAHAWVGTTVEDQCAADARIPHLLAVPARVRFLSCEPLLGPVDLGAWDETEEWTEACSGCVSDCDEWGNECTTCPGHPRFAMRSRVQWVIAGGESGPQARPMDPAWARSLRDQCAESGVPFFFKQWGEWDAGGRRVGKATAARTLDGVIHNDVPRSAPC
jgi:protein gp37